ncbi:MAG: DNA-binding protein [Alphaproteobacteria bacterium 65-7]|nr:MAG: DNA-binding protein [Alphaproteobacteria bacterium 65-7]
MTITAAQARAARALVQWPRDHVARLAGLEVALLEAIEQGRAELDATIAERLQNALESGGALFIPESDDRGVGVRLKFSSIVVQAIDSWEDEGGAVGSDDV